MSPSTPEELEQSFHAAENGGGPGHGAVRRRLLPNSDLDVFTEVRLPSREWVLVVHSDDRLDDRDLVLATGLVCRTRNGSVEVVASPDTDRRLFCTLLADLVNQLSLPADKPVVALVRRLNAWRRMLGRGLTTGLPPEARIGLYGELLVLRELMLPAIGPNGVKSWVGPDGAPQDFQHLSTAVEVKTVSRRDPGRCRISNEQQLDTSSIPELFLIHQAVGTSPDGTTLGELIDELRDHPAVRAELSWFENCLLEVGWLDAHRDQYVNDRYVLARRQAFSVDASFPRITPADLPAGVSAVSYFVDLSACSSHRVDERIVRDAVTGTSSLAKE
ncbi:PD-(D/E)XK motif protein [Microbispora sp. CSR-4]|uniref:PD-(D/E)XK motif protein n=1 Tax=Microbispora sp. CSR-4 TaxID=2592813 RepID=UPI0016509D60|nr:PD-(D/E)XK motif protein [Microbispora sp. CSR-4]